jgi:hypothetical protein
MHIGSVISGSGLLCRRLRRGAFDLLTLKEQILEPGVRNPNKPVSALPLPVPLQ